MEARPLSGDEIRVLVGDVAKRLGPQGEQHTLIVVGGSLLAWHGLRDTTEDVDTARHFDDELRDAIAEVAREHGLQPDWLNSKATPFRPATLDQASCDLLLDHARLLVLGAPLRAVFVMKMYRADPNDIADMVEMWPHLGFTSAAEAVDAYCAAYPHAPGDEHLDEFVVAVAAGAGEVLPRS